jgi:CarD family transcriptional regulator
MQFVVGETLVYPHHGAVTVVAVETRNVRGEEKTYLRLNVHTSELEIQLPIDNVDLVGVRDVIDDAGVQEVYEVLRADVVEEPANWSRRYKANQEKMASGSVIRVSEVVRDLWRRDVQSGLSAGEKRMLQKTRQILVSELALALGVPDEKASEELEQVLATVAA